MTLPWSAAQVEWLRGMGFDVLELRTSRHVAAEVAIGPSDGRAFDAPAPGTLPPAFARAARGVDITPLLALGIPGDVAARRALWRALRPLRKASRTS